MGFGSIMGSIGLGGASSAASTAMQYQADRKLQHDAQDFTKKQWLNKHQWEASDLEKAGFNRILTTKYGGSPASSGTVSGSKAESPLKGASTAMALNIQQSQKDLIDAQTLKTKSETKKMSGKAEIGGAIGSLLSSAKQAGSTLWDRIKSSPKKTSKVFFESLPMNRKFKKNPKYSKPNRSNFKNKYKD